MQSEGEVRHLLIAEEWNDDYFDPELHNVADRILIEVDEISGGKQYEVYILDKGSDLNEDNKILLLYGILELWNASKNDALEVIETLKLKYKTKEAVKIALNNRLFDKEVEEAQKTDTEEKKKITFENLIIPIENYFKRDISSDVTVAKYFAYIDAINDIESRKKA